MRTIISKSLKRKNQSVDSKQVLGATQNRYSMALFREPGRHVRDLLSNSFDVRLVSLYTPINHFDCCLIDCRGKNLEQPELLDIDVFAGVKFVLIDESTVTSNATKAINGPFQLITEREIDSPTLTLRVSAHSLTHGAFKVNNETANNLKEKQGGVVSKAGVDNKTMNQRTKDLVGDKFASASHDIRQPLQAMSLFIHSLESKLSNEQQHNILSKLKQSALSVNNSLEDMLGLLNPGTSHTESGDTVTHASKTDVPSFISDTLNANKPMNDYTVMVLDDNEEVVGALETTLQDAGFHVYPATNLAEACEIINEIDQLPDVLLVDFNLGNNCEGDDAIRTIRDKAKSNIPSIVLTSETCSAKLHRAEEIASSVLSKPVQVERLLTSITHSVEQAVAQ